MSNDENTNEVENQIEEASSKVEEVVKEVVDEGTEAASTAKENIAAKAMDLKESNPKLFFAGIGAVLLVLAVVMMSGGNSTKTLPAAKNINIAIGQNYKLVGVNTYDPDATVRLVAVPGSMAAYDESEEGGGDGVCKRMPQGTKVKAVETQKAYGTTEFVEVEMIEGKCAGKKGWVVATNLN